MANTPKSPSTGPNKRRSSSGRKPVTINLDAEPMANKTGAAKPDIAKAQPEKRVETAKPDNEAKSKAATKESVVAKDGAKSGEKAAASDISNPKSDKQAPKNNKPPVQKASQTGGSSSGNSMGGVAGGLIGGGLVAVLGYGALALGLLPVGGSSNDGIAEQYTQITTQMGDLTSRLTALEAAPAISSEISAQIADLETQIASIKDAATSQAGDGEANTATAALTDLENQIAELRQTGELNANSASESRKAIADLQARVSAGASGEAPALAALSDRLSGLDKQLASIKQIAAVSTSAPSVDLGPLEQQISALGSTIAALTENSSSLSGQVEKNSTELAALAEQTATLSAANATKEADGQVAKAAFSAAALKTAIDGGKPFTIELAYFASVSPDAADSVAALQPFAESGVPNLGTLQSSFGVVASNILNATKPTPAGFGGKLLNNLQSLVEVRPTGAEAGDTPRAIVGRMTAALNSGDLSTVISEAEALPEAGQTAASDFLTNVSARNAANTMMQTILATGSSNAALSN